MKRLIGLGLFGFAVASCLIYNQNSFNLYSQTYDRTVAQITEWENRSSDLLAIRGNITDVVESVSQMNGDSSDSSPAIEQAASNLETVWARYHSTIPAAFKMRLDTGINQMAQAAMRTADSVRRKDIHSARQQAQGVTDIAASLSPVLTEAEHELAQGRKQSETERLRALEGMTFGQRIEVSIFLVLAVAFVGFLGVGLSGFVGRIVHQPQPAAATTSRGFSLTEVLMVVAITLVLSTIAIENIAAVVSSSRIRAGISSMSGLLQNCRMLAVKKNKTLTAHVSPGGVGTLMGYVKDAGDTTPLSTGDTQVKWEAPVVRMATPTGPGAPDQISATVLGYTPQTADISFNSRGLPCAYASGVCTNYGFLYYFKDTSRQGAKGWAALSVSPAGKIKKWFWNNHIWTE